MERSSESGLAYRTSGEGQRVVLVHGIPGSARAWDGVAAALPDVEVVIPDLLGFGASADPTTFSVEGLGPERQSRALEQLLDELGRDRVVLVGHDFGGPVSILLAARRPDLVSALLLLSANAFPDTPIPFPLSLTTLPVVGAVVGRALFSPSSLRLMLKQGVGAGAAPLEPATHLGDRRQRRAIATIFSGALRRLDEIYTPVEDALRGLDAPVVVGWGDRDPFFPIAQGERTADAAGGRLTVFGGAGHFLPHERPRQVAEEVEKLVASLDTQHRDG